MLFLVSGAGAGIPVNGAGHPAMNGGGMGPMSAMQPGAFPQIAGPQSNGSADLDHDLVLGLGLALLRPALHLAAGPHPVLVCVRV